MKRLITAMLRRTDQTAAEVQQPEIVGYSAVVMTSGRKLVLGQPCGSDGWAATTLIPVHEGENGFSRALAAVDSQWGLDGSPALTWGLRSVWRVNGQLAKVDWWFRDIGATDALPALDGFAEVAVQEPYQVLNGSVRRANSTVPLLPLRLVRSFVNSQPPNFLRR